MGRFGGFETWMNSAVVGPIGSAIERSTEHHFGIPAGQLSGGGSRWRKSSAMLSSVEKVTPGCLSM